MMPEELALRTEIPQRDSHCETYDVCIIGAGLAGLCLTRQLLLEMPALRIALVERQVAPLPKATHKVGESLIEAGAHYLLNTLQLSSYLRASHLPKAGLRWYLAGLGEQIQDRLEFGAFDFPLLPSVQIDRGVFEEDLRNIIRTMGGTLYEGYSVQTDDITLAPTYHEILISKNGIGEHLKCAWLIDASGRRRLLASKLQLSSKVDHSASACWWRLPGKWDLTDIIPRRPPHIWHEREFAPRFLSTNHICGSGYWIWIIPLQDHTSFGIVADQSIHPISIRSTYQNAQSWLREHEPQIAEWLKGSEPSDFLAVKNFSHNTVQYYSTDRWGIVGEAAVFLDPYLSTGTDLIALGSNLITRLIIRWKAGISIEDAVSAFNRLKAEYVSALTAGYSGMYEYFGNPNIHYQKITWDIDYFFSSPHTRLGFMPHILDRMDYLLKLTALVRSFADLNRNVSTILRKWARLPNSTKISEVGRRSIGPGGLLIPNHESASIYASCARYCSIENFIRDLETIYLPNLSRKAKLIETDYERAVQENTKIWNVERTKKGTSVGKIDELRKAPKSTPIIDRSTFFRNVPTPMEAIRLHARFTPDSLAVWQGETKITYPQLCQTVDRLCDLLRRVVEDKHIIHVIVPRKRNWMNLPFALAGMELGVSVGFGPGGNGSNIIDLTEYSINIFEAPILSPILAETSGFGVCYGVYKEAESHKPSSLLPAFISESRRDFRDRPKAFSAYSLMQLCSAARLAIEFGSDELQDYRVKPRIIMSLTFSEYDWLIALVMGAALVLPVSNKLVEAVRELGALRCGVGEQIIVAAESRELAKLSEYNLIGKADMGLSIGTPLNEGDVRIVTGVFPRIVDAGLIDLGDEDYRPKRFG
jgi:flavin-dependent dehydrogenase